MSKNNNPVAIERYSNRSLRAGRLHRSDSVYTRQFFSVILTLLFVICDAITIKNLWNSVVLDNPILNILLTVTVAVVLNVPLAIAGVQMRMSQQGLTNRKRAITILILSIATFAIVFAIQLWFRLDSKDIIFGTAQGGFTSSLNPTEQVDTSSKTLVPAWFSGILPLTTSIASFLVNLCSDPLGTRICRYEKEIIQIDANIEHLDKILEESERIGQYKAFLIARENDAFNNFVDNTRTASGVLKNAVRIALMEMLRSADAISALSESGEEVNQEVDSSLISSNAQEDALAESDCY